MTNVVTKEVPLRAKDGSIRAVAIVDAIDYERAMKYTWSLSGNGYALRHRSKAEKLETGRTHEYLHRFILGLSPQSYLHVDHLDRDRLNCVRSNLTTATHMENCSNVPGSKKTSEHRGVYWNRRNGKWLAQCTVRGTQHYLGSFTDELEAAAVAAEFRAQNQPGSPEFRSRHGA